MVVILYGCFKDKWDNVYEDFSLIIIIIIFIIVEWILKLI